MLNNNSGKKNIINDHTSKTKTNDTSKAESNRQEPNSFHLPNKINFDNCKQTYGIGVDLTPNVNPSPSHKTTTLSKYYENKLNLEEAVINFETTKFCIQCNGYDQFLFENRLICLCQIVNYRDNNDPFPHQMFFDKPGQIYNYIQKCRRWIPVWRPRSFSRNKEFSITTYNILAQNLLLNHLYLYRDNIKSDLEWCERSNRLKNELIELNSDIFCLQEFNIEHFNNTIWPSLKDRGYQMVFKQKTGNNLDGCSILFKKSKFQLQGLLELEMNRSDVSHLLDRDQVALVVKLRPNCPIGTNATNLIIANTHLLFNPKRGDIKLAQLRLLLAEIQRFAINNNNKGEKSNSHNPYQLNYFPIIVCGDFNSEPNSPLINFMQTGKFNFHGIRAGDISGQRDGIEKGPYITRKDLQMMGINSNCCYDENNAQKSEELNLSDEIDEDLTIKHVFNLKSVYPSVDKFNLKLISTSTYYDCGLVDYLFYSHKHQNLHLSAFKQLINKQNLKKIGTIPNSILGSDHLSLSAKFYLT